MLCCIVLLVGLIGIRASAAVINVPGDFPTIALAIDNSLPGDEIVVAPGLYFAPIQFFQANVTVRSSGGPLVTTIDIDPGEISFQNLDTSVLEGFTLINGTRLDGAGIDCSGSSPTIRECIFENNTANTDIFSTGRGGAAYIHGPSAPTFINCVFRNNIAKFGGAVYSGPNSTPIFIQCIFQGNFASLAGGAVYDNRSDPTFINCTFDGNVAAVGGPALYSTNFSLPSVTNCIFSNHGTTPIFDSDSLTTVTFSVISTVWNNATSFANLFNDPVYIDSANGDFRLSPDSPGIDAGFNWAFPETLPAFDFNGLPRYADRTATPDTGCGFDFVVDMGAYEFQGIPGSPCRGDTDGSGNTNVTDLLTLLATWGLCGTSCCIADFDGSGLVDVTDLLALLAAWGACP